MAEKKSIYEEAILDAKKIREALNANTKEILRSVAKEEIDGMVKESLMEDDYEEETIDSEDDAIEDDSAEGSEEAPEMGDETGAEMGDDSEVEVGAGEGSDFEEIQTPDEVGDDQDLDMDADAFGGDELDMTASSDDDVIAIYKKLSGDDEIEVVGDDVHITVSEPGEYIIKGGAGASGAGAGIGGDELGFEDDEMDLDIDGEMGELGGDEFGSEEEVETPEFGAEGGETEEAPAMGDDEVAVDDEESDDEAGLTYEIAMEDDEVVAEEDETEEDVVEESIPVGNGQAHRLPAKADIGQPKGAGASGLKENVSSKKVISETEIKYNRLLTEAAQLKNENEEFRKALKKFRSMLVETVVFNANLSYVTKLFMEHSTTKNEKQTIIKRFDDEVTNLKESKRLYKTIVSELSTRKPITEAVENKIMKEVTGGGSKQLNEATAYVDPSTQRINDLIKRVEKR